MPAIQLLIKGKVQGVFYRASAKEVAETLDLRGWVKNTPDGDVELVATGSESSLQQFIEWCKQGPEAAIVSSVNLISVEEENFAEFKILRG